MFSKLYHWSFPFLGNVMFRFPSRKLFVVGVTGTKGKSTVLELMNAIMEAAGKKTSLLSSVRRKICLHDGFNTSGNTMPGRFSIQRFLRESVDAGCEYAFIEVTSQGVVQYRDRFVEWDAAVCTNLAPEHIESHGSFEAYREAKVSFFRSLRSSGKPTKYFFINEDDDHHHYFEDAAKRIPNSKIIFFSREQFIKSDLGGEYNLASPKSRRLLGDWLSADFNLENAAAAVAFARTQGVSWDVIQKALSSFRGVPGRLEFVQKTPFTVVVDYAHTPDSLKKIYEAVMPAATPSRSQKNLICVLGAAGGGRDKWKRPEMGRIAAEYCNKIILTSEDPYDEKPEDIVKSIENGFLSAKKPALDKKYYFSVPNRREAIRKAFSLAKKGDTVVLTGKGSEQWIHIEDGKKIPWNERRIAEEELGRIK